MLSTQPETKTGLFELPLCPLKKIHLNGETLTMTHFLRFVLVFGTFGACIVSCSKPHDKVIPLDRKKWDADLRPVIERLSDEDRQYLKRYLARASGPAEVNRVPPGTTIGDAISVQKSLEAQRRANEEQQRQFAREAEIEAQRRAPIVLKLVDGKRLASALVELTFIVANHGEEEIRAVKGKVRVTDAVNDTITSAEILIVGPIPPKNSIQTKATFGCYEPDMLLHNPIGLAFDLSKVIFADGSELIVPKQD
jgi:hypothetical protein